MHEPDARITHYEADTAFSCADEAYQRVRDILRSSRSFDIGNYKDKCMKRRIAIRIRATQCGTADEYCRLLDQNDRERDLLLKVLTIHVSQFFRNFATFEKLHTDIIPLLFARSRADGRQRLSIWSVGCSSGEEPYTLAIILRMYFSSEINETPVSILATDINQGILDTALRGEFVSERLQEAPAPVRARFFTYSGDKYLLADEIKGMVTFRQGDLADASSYVESDLILCRNVLIYFERKEQEEILCRFANALSPGGILVLGKAETLVGRSRNFFEALCPIERIYVRRSRHGLVSAPWKSPGQ